MVTVVTREANGIPLTHDQVDDNFTGLADAINNLGDDVLAPAIAAKDAAVTAANSAQTSALSASNSANAASISQGNAATSAEASAASLAAITAPNGADVVGITSPGSSYAKTVGYVLQSLYLLDAYLPELNWLTEDATAAVNSALSAIATRGGGVVHAGPHAYMLSGVVIPHGVHFLGHSQVTTLFNPSTTVPTLLVESFCGVQGVRAYYPNQTTTGAPIPHAPFITSSGTGPVGASAYVTLKDIDLNNSYDGIVLGTSTIGCGPIWIDHILGWPMHIGLSLDNCTDVPYLNGIHFNPNANIVSDYTQAQVYQTATAYDFARVDGVSATNIFAFGYSKGLKLRSGAPSGSANMVRITNFGFDICRSPIDIGFHQDGVFLTSGFCTTGGANYKGVSGGSCVIGGGQTSPQGKVTVSNVSFRNYVGDVVGVTSNCDFSMCTFTDYNRASGEFSAIRVAGDGVALNVTGGSLDGHGRAGSSGITSDGFAGNNMRVIGVEFVGMSSHDILLNGGGSLSVFGNTDSVGSSWNFVPFAHTNGVMSTYQDPSTFPGADPANFHVGTSWVNQLSAVGAPRGWMRPLAASFISLGNL